MHYEKVNCTLNIGIFMDKPIWCKGGTVKGRVGRKTGVGGLEESRSWVNGIHGRG